MPMIDTMGVMSVTASGLALAAAFLIVRAVSILEACCRAKPKSRVFRR